MIPSRGVIRTMALVVCALAGACQEQAAPPAAPAKRPVSKRDAPELAAKPPLNRGAKKVAASKPGDGRVALVKAASPPPVAITAGRPVNGSLSRSDVQFEDGSFVDYYSYTGTRGEQLLVTLRSTAFDAYLLAGSVRNGVFDPDDEDDDSAGNTDAQLDLTVTVSGVIIIAVNSVDAGETGPYTLELRSSRSGAPPGNTGRGGGGGGGSTDVGELAFNSPANGRLEPGDRQMTRDKTFYDYWIFDGRAGQRVTITMRSDAFDAYLILKAGPPSNSETIAEDDDGGGGLHARITATLPETGPYTVVANSTEAGGGAYTITLESAGGGGSGSGGRGVASAPSIAYAERYPGNGDPNERYALVVGIADYPGTDNDLRGPVADAQIFRDMLVTKFGFKPGNIVMLTDASATREHILNAFVRHLGQAGPQGTAVFYYSGHGTQMSSNLALTAPLDPEADGRDEALFVWGTDEKSSYILDDEIGYLIDQLKTDKVLLVHDSCHSGTSSKGGVTGGQSKEIIFTKEVAAASYTPLHYTVGAKAAQSPGRGQSLGDILESKRPYGLLAGSKDDELSWTAAGWPDKGGLASVFTYYLVTTLESSNEQTTWSQVMSKVQSLTNAYTLKTYKEQQNPQLGGTIANRTIASLLR